jgi:hypothetical protein
LSSTTHRTSIRGFRKRGATPNRNIAIGTSGRRSAPPAPRRVSSFPGVQKSTWNYDNKAKAWYFHRFCDFQPDLNTAHPEVQAEILKIMGFWILLGVAGFRMDAVPFMIASKGPAGLFAETQRSVIEREDARKAQSAGYSMRLSDRAQHRQHAGGHDMSPASIGIIVKTAWAATTLKRAPTLSGYFLPPPAWPSRRKPPLSEASCLWHPDQKTPRPLPVLRQLGASISMDPSLLNKTSQPH